MLDTLFSVKDHVVLITGGSRGIGKELASAFASRGAQVIIAGRNKETLNKAANEINTSSNSVSSEVCDVSSSDDVEVLVNSLANLFQV